MIPGLLSVPAGEGGRAGEENWLLYWSSFDLLCSPQTTCYMLCMQTCKHPSTHTLTHTVTDFYFLLCPLPGQYTSQASIQWAVFSTALKFQGTTCTCIKAQCTMEGNISGEYMHCYTVSYFFHIHIRPSRINSLFELTQPWKSGTVVRSVG